LEGKSNTLIVGNSGFHNTEKCTDLLSGCWSSLSSGCFNHVDGIFKGISSRSLKFPYVRFRSVASFSLETVWHPPAPGVFLFVCLFACDKGMRDRYTPLFVFKGEERLSVGNRLRNKELRTYHLLSP
jgi:hypothetical protein